LRVFVDANLIIYLNIPLPADDASIIEEFWLDLVKRHNLYTDVLVLDEVIYISKRKYRVPARETLEFIDRAVLPYVDLLPLRMEEYLEAKRLIREYPIAPSDALHAAVVRTNNLDAVVSEDRDFDKIGIKRIWPLS